MSLLENPPRRISSQFTRDSCGCATQTPLQSQAVMHIETEQHDVRRTGKEFECLHRIKSGVEVASMRL